VVCGLLLSPEPSWGKITRGVRHLCQTTYLVASRSSDGNAMYSVSSDGYSGSYSVSPTPIGPTDRQLVGANPHEVWATPAGIEGRVVFPGEPPRYVSAWLLLWEDISRLREDVASDRWAPPYVQLAVTPY
jgi:hypothetical protein